MAMASVSSSARRGSCRAFQTAAQIVDKDLFLDKALIGGHWTEALSKETFPVVDPATGNVLTSVPAMDKEDATRAVEAAVGAFHGWKHTTLKERASVLRRWSALVKSNSKDLSLLMCLESGKPLTEARGEIGYALSFIDFYAGERANGLVIPPSLPSQRLLVTKEPVGVCSLITPWNFPAALTTRKAAPALLAGCSLVLKPAEDTPLTSLALAQLAMRAGVPPGVFNVVTTPRELVPGVGGVLSGHPGVRKVSFTGSTEVGKVLLHQAAGTVKRVSLELGGNAPLVVFDDAKLDLAVEHALAAKFRFGGQTCISPNRFFVEEGIHDDFCHKMAERIARLKVGNGADQGTAVGPLINAAAKEKVAALVEDAISHGAVAKVGGALNHEMGPNYFMPTLLVDCPPHAQICREEIFGPVANVVGFRGVEEAVSVCNSTRSGLAGYVFTQDYAKGLKFAEAMEVGMVGVNDCNISKEVIPFGGVKESGLGREGSVLGLDEYLETKHICLGGL
ncbi:unnamed protein product [Discosporangium mesarthrocarpum]